MTIDMVSRRPRRAHGLASSLACFTTIIAGLTAAAVLLKMLIGLAS
ncbi:MAG: hypothetical protein QM608_04350 [Caulobacter sp.]